MIDSVVLDEFENMIRAATEGYMFPLAYVQDTLFKEIKKDCKYNIVKEPYDNNDVTVEINSMCNHYMNIGLTILPDNVEEIGECYVNKILINIKLPFSSNLESNSDIVVKFLLYNDSVQFSVCDFDLENGDLRNLWCEHCISSKTVLSSFEEVIKFTAYQINEFYDKYGTNHKNENKNNTSLDEFDSMWSALKEDSLGDSIDK